MKDMQKKRLPSVRTRIKNFLVAMLAVLAVRILCGTIEAMGLGFSLTEVLRLAMPKIWSQYLGSLAVGAFVFLLLEYRTSKKANATNES